MNVTVLGLMELMFHQGHLVQLLHLTEGFIISRISQYVSTSNNSMEIRGHFIYKAVSLLHALLMKG